MPVIYWIEDESNLLLSTIAALEARGCRVVQVSTAMEMPGMLNEARRIPGPIIVDLWLPNHEVDGKVYKGSDVGIWILIEVRRQLGGEWPLVVLSGNISIDAQWTLEHECGIPPQRQFFKPLVDRDSFVAAVYEQAERWH